MKGSPTEEVAKHLVWLLLCKLDYGFNKKLTIKQYYKKISISLHSVLCSCTNSKTNKKGKKKEKKENKTVYWMDIAQLGEASFIVNELSFDDHFIIQFCTEKPIQNVFLFKVP